MPLCGMARCGQLRAHCNARAIGVKVAFHTVHERRKAPKGVRFVVHHRQHRGCQVAHALTIPCRRGYEQHKEYVTRLHTEVKVPHAVGQQHAPQRLLPLTMLLRKAWVRAVGAPHVLVHPAAALAPLGKARRLPVIDARPLRTQRGVTRAEGGVVRRTLLCGPCRLVHPQEKLPRRRADLWRQPSMENAPSQPALIHQPPRGIEEERPLLTGQPRSPHARPLPCPGGLVHQLKRPHARGGRDGAGRCGRHGRAPEELELVDDHAQHAARWRGVVRPVVQQQVVQLQRVERAEGVDGGVVDQQGVGVVQALDQGDALLCILWRCAETLWTTPNKPL